MPSQTPPYTPSGYWFRPPFTPRYSVPESFGEALSYEAQIHWLAGCYNDVVHMMENANFIHFMYGADKIVHKGWEHWHPFEYWHAQPLDGQDPKPGDWVGLCVPESDSLYDPLHAGMEELVIARVVAWARPCNKLTLEFFYAIHDPSERLRALEYRCDQLEDRVGKIEKYLKNLWALFNSLLDHIPGAPDADHETGGWKTPWPEGQDIAIGNLNIYANPTDPTDTPKNFIRTHADPVRDNDIWVQD